MSGRVKRKLGLAADAARVAADADVTVPCWLCARPIGATSEWHHPVPKSRGGRTTVAVHPLCHRTIHAAATNAELAEAGETADHGRAALIARPAVARFLAWVADKPADFRVPVRRAAR